jgi:hypothetical protein
VKRLWCSSPKRRLPVIGKVGRYAVLMGLSLLAGTCTETLDAGRNASHGPLPVDERNPVIIYQDDWSGDWLGAYAVLLANTGGPQLAGIIVNASKIWTDLNINASGWRDLVTAAQGSGLQSIPVVTPSTGAPLTRPTDGQIDSTAPNGSAGARLIVDISRQLSVPARPVVVVSATSLTDIADAYLLDHTVVDRVVVVAALGSFTAPDGIMGPPNGDMDPWADWIVAERFRYVHASAWYDQTGDITAAEIPNLPQNPLGSLMASRQPNIIKVTTASDQVALLAVALPGFVLAVQRVSPDTAATFDSRQGPRLLPDANGKDWIVTQVDAPLAAARLWEMLLDPRTFIH